MPRRYYSSTAVATTLSGNINNSTTSITVTALSGYPTQFPYTAIIDPDTASEEVVTVTAASGTTLTVTRGSDGTSAVSHNAGAVFRHGVSARDFDEANAFANGGGVSNSLIANSKGALITSTGSAVAALTVGTNGHALLADSGATNGVKWGAVGKVLQVIRATDSTTRSTTSTSFVDASRSVTITPISASSSIMVIASGVAQAVWTTGDTQTGALQISDNSNNAISGADNFDFGLAAISGAAGSKAIFAPYVVIGYNSPNTTSAVTYKLRFRSDSANLTFRLFNESPRGIGQMFAIEIGA